jgi:hypothetical protein
MLDGLVQWKTVNVNTGDFTGGTPTFTVPTQCNRIDQVTIPTTGSPVLDMPPQSDVRGCDFIVTDRSGTAATYPVLLYCGGGTVNGSGLTFTLNQNYGAVWIRYSTTGAVSATWLAMAVGHAQNTDAGTTSATWDLDSDGSTGTTRLKATGAAAMAFRNSADTAYADLDYGKATINGPLIRPPRVITAAATIAATDGAIVADAAAGAMTVTLPAAVNGKMIPIIAPDGTNVVTIARAGTDTIQGGLTSFGMPVLSTITLYAYNGVWYYF